MTTPTFIAVVDLLVSPGDRPAAMAHLERERPIVRAMTGCADFRPFTSAEDDRAITVLHEWVDRAAFQRYLSSEAFARSGDHLRPLLLGAPSSRRFDVVSVEVAA